MKLDSLVRLRVEPGGAGPFVVLKEPHQRPGDPEGLLYVTVQPRNAAGAPFDVPVADVVEVSP